MSRHEQQHHTQTPPARRRMGWPTTITLICTVIVGVSAALTIPYAVTFQWFADMSKMPSIVKADHEESVKKFDVLTSRVDAGFSNNAARCEGIENQVGNLANQVSAMAKAVSRINNQRGLAGDRFGLTNLYVSLPATNATQ